MPFFTSPSGLSLYYEKTGTDPTKPLCVLISGLSRDHGIWRKLVPLLEKDYRVITIDNRDVGQSSLAREDYGIADMAEDIAALLRENQLVPAHIVGHSMGGFIALHVAANYATCVKSLVLCSTIEKQDTMGKQYLQARIQGITPQDSSIVGLFSRQSILALMPYLYAAKHCDDDSFVDEIIAYEMNNPHPQKPEGFLRQAHACIAHDASHLLMAIQCPTLVLTGEADKIYPPNTAVSLAAKLNHAEYAMIPDAAHMIQLENPIYLYHTLRYFFAGADGSHH